MGELRLFGPTTVLDSSGGQTVVSAPRVRTLAALLALTPGVARTSDWLIEQLWSEPPVSARKALQNAVVALRRDLGAQRVQQEGGTYALDAAGLVVDRHEFERQVNLGAQLLTTGQSVAAARVLESAMGLWRGQPYAGLSDIRALEDDRTLLADLHRQAQVDLFDARLGSGLVVRPAEIAVLVAEQRWNERLWCLNARALAVQGRHAEALDTLREGMEELADRGLEASPEVASLEAELLQHSKNGKPASNAGPRSSSGVVELPGWAPHLIALDRWVTRASDGFGALAVISGAAGMGKTSLLQLATQRYGRGGAAATVIPIRMAHHAGLLQSALDLELGERSLRELSLQNPVLLTIEDAHWASDAAQVIADLMPQVVGHRIGVVVTTRPGAEAESLATLAVRQHGEVVRLDALDGTDLRAVLSANHLLAGDLAEADLERIVERSGGVPLFATFFAHRFSDDDVLVDREGLRTLVRDELARLGADARELANLLAICQEPAELGLLVAATKHDAASIREALAQLIGSRLAHEVPGSILAVELAHDLITDAVRESLTGMQEQALHSAIFHGLHADGPAAPGRTIQTARHAAAMAASGEPADLAHACAAARRAATTTASVGAHGESAEWFHQALTFQGHALEEPAVAERGELLLGRAREQFLDAHVATKLSFKELFDFAEDNDAGDLAVRGALAWDRGMFSRVANVNRERVRALDRVLRRKLPHQQRARATAALASELTWARDGERRFDLAEEALQLARAHGTVEDLAYVLGHRPLTLAAIDTTELRREATDELLALAADLDDPHLRFNAVFQAAGPAVSDGDVVRLDDLLDEASGLADRLGVREYQWMAAFSQASLRLLQGDLAGAEVMVMEAFAVGELLQRSADPSVIMGGQLLEIRRIQGRLTELVPLIANTEMPGQRDGLIRAKYLAEAGETELVARFLDDASVDVLLTRLPMQRSLVDAVATLAAVLGDSDLAALVTSRLPEFADELCIGSTATASGHHSLGLAAVGRKDYTSAVDHFRQSLDRHTQGGHPLLAAESRLALLRALDLLGAPDSPERSQLQRQAVGAADRYGIRLALAW